MSSRAAAATRTFQTAGQFCFRAKSIHCSAKMSCLLSKYVVDTNIIFHHLKKMKKYKRFIMFESFFIASDVTFKRIVILTGLNVAHSTKIVSFVVHT